jgi:AraC-like DNA-binding protein
VSVRRQDHRSRGASVACQRSHSDFRRLPTGGALRRRCDGADPASRTAFDERNRRCRHQADVSVRNRGWFDLAKRAARARLAWAVPASRRVTIADRVEERRRAVALARHFREEEDLSITQIADRLGRSPGTVKAYFYDPTGDKARAVKARYRGICRGCGADTQPRNGKGDAYAYCKACRPGAIRGRWTSESVLAAMRRWRALYGRLPSSYDWSRTHARRRGRQAIGRLESGAWPAASVVTSVLGSWPAARARAESGVDEIRWKHEAPSLGDAE